MTLKLYGILIRIKSWLEQYLKDLNRFNSWVKRLSRNCGFLAFQDPESNHDKWISWVLIQIDSRLKVLPLFRFKSRFKSTRDSSKKHLILSRLMIWLWVIPMSVSYRTTASVTGEVFWLGLLLWRVGLLLAATRLKIRDMAHKRLVNSRLQRCKQSVVSRSNTRNSSRRNFINGIRYTNKAHTQGKQDKHRRSARFDNLPLPVPWQSAFRASKTAGSSGRSRFQAQHSRLKPTCVIHSESSQRQTQTTQGVF